MKRLSRIPSRKEFRAGDEAISKRLKQIMESKAMKTCPTCNIPIQDHPANACLDALFAELVMGWEKSEQPGHYWDEDELVWLWLRPEGGGRCVKTFNPSTNISHAMEGVEKADRSMALSRVDKNEWLVVFNTDLWKCLSSKAKTPELTITRALILWAMEKE